MSTFWDERFSKPDYAYGELPNQFFKDQLDLLPSGSILLPAEGEGRNAVYAALKGWEVEAFDASVEGRKKAIALAEKAGVSFSYLVRELREVMYTEASFDVIALIYMHLPSNQMAASHRKLLHFLKPGGRIMLEAFGPKHPAFQKLNPQVGGPLDADLLIGTDQIRNDFAQLDIEMLEEVEIELNEGLFHVGKGSVVRFVGRKKE
jgi:SAM-dependent methyltransferase